MISMVTWWHYPYSYHYHYPYHYHCHDGHLAASLCCLLPSTAGVARLGARTSARIIIIVINVIIIIIIISSVRSSNSHPDLLVITTSTPTFSVPHQSSTLDFLSHYCYIKGNHWTRLLATCILERVVAR